MTKELTETKKLSVIDFMATKYGMEKEAFEAVLRKTIMPTTTKTEELVAFLSVAKEYNLNPITKEVYAFPSKSGGITPIVSVDGWARIMNDHPQHDGVEFNDIIENGQVVAIECRIYRKDRKHPICTTEYLVECKGTSEPWKRWPRRMLRHKAFIQCGRIAYGFSGIYDADEAERIEEGMINITPKSKTANTHQVPPALEKSFNVPSVFVQDAATNLEAITTVSTLPEGYEEQAIEIKTDNSEAIEAAFKKVSEGLRSMKTEKAVNMAFDVSYKDDIEFLNKHKNDYYHELVAIKNAKLEALK